MQIGVPDLVRTLAKRPRHRSAGTAAEAVVVPLVTSLTRVSASDFSHDAPPLKRGSTGYLGTASYGDLPRRSPYWQIVWELQDGVKQTRWEPVSRLPPVTYRTVQQTPLGEWPLVAA